MRAVLVLMAAVIFIWAPWASDPCGRSGFVAHADSFADPGITAETATIVIEADLREKTVDEQLGRCVLVFEVSDLLWTIGSWFDKPSGEVVEASDVRAGSVIDVASPLSTRLVVGHSYVLAVHEVSPTRETSSVSHYTSVVLDDNHEALTGLGWVHRLELELGREPGEGVLDVLLDVISQNSKLRDETRRNETPFRIGERAQTIRDRQVALSRADLWPPDPDGPPCTEVSGSLVVRCQRLKEIAGELDVPLEYPWSSER